MSRARLSVLVLLAALGACSDVVPTEPTPAAAERPAGLMRNGGHVDPGAASTDTTTTKKKPKNGDNFTTTGLLGSGG